MDAQIDEAHSSQKTNLPALFLSCVTLPDRLYRWPCAVSFRFDRLGKL